MNRPSLLLAIPILALAGCERAEDSGAEVAAKTARQAAPAGERAKGPKAPILNLGDSTVPKERQAANLRNGIYRISDDDLGLVIESIASLDDPELKRSLLATVYEETVIRPDLTRLPLMLEVARQPDVGGDLRLSILAELGSLLDAEHGASWPDWALALDEHLARTEGLLRLE